jgi:hypothetical protein
MKRDHQPQSTNIPGTSSNSNNNSRGVSKASLQFHEQQSFSHGSVLALNMHPEKNKGLMLVLSRQPGQLRVVNMTTYKTLSYCDGFTGISAYLIHENEEDYSTGLFYRSGFSADGKYIICCVPVNKDLQNKGGGGHSASQIIEKGMYQLLVWDTYTGHPVTTSLSSNVSHSSSSKSGPNSCFFLFLLIRCHFPLSNSISCLASMSTFTGRFHGNSFSFSYFIIDFSYFLF